MGRMNATQAMALARFIEPARTDWQIHGIKAAILNIPESWEVAAWIAIQCAADPTARTPGAMSNPIYRTGTATPTAEVPPSTGRDNVRRLREEQAALEATKATPDQITARLSGWRNRTKAST